MRIQVDFPHSRPLGVVFRVSQDADEVAATLGKGDGPAPFDLPEGASRVTGSVLVEGMGEVPLLGPNWRVSRDDWLAQWLEEAL